MEVACLWAIRLDEIPSKEVIQALKANRRQAFVVCGLECELDEETLATRETTWM